MIHAFVSSRLDYCNSLLYGLPQVEIDKIQRVQNAAARHIFEQPKFCHITPVLSQLHWLPMKYRIELKILMMTFKAIHNMAPDYICKLISRRKSTGYSLRSSKKVMLEVPSRKILPTLCGRATGDPGSVIVPQYRSSKITVFVWGKNTIQKFLGNTK